MHRSTERQRKKKQLDLLKARDLTGKTRRKRQVQDISVLDLEGHWTVLAKSLWGCLLQLWQFKRSHQLLQLMVMKSPPVFLHWCWYWLFCPHLEQCWPHILIRNNQGIHWRANLFYTIVQCCYSHFVVSLWLVFAKWRRQKLKRHLPTCFLQVTSRGRGERG